MHKRRGSIGSNAQTFSCIVPECPNNALRKGWYCAQCQNNANNASETEHKAEKPLARCLGSVCQGQIREQYCDRHRPVTEPSAAPAAVEVKEDSSSNQERKQNVQHKAHSLSQISTDSEEFKERMTTFLTAIRNISSELDAEVLVSTVVHSVCSVLRCDRVSVYMVDEAHQQLELILGKGAKGIRFPLSSGIAGFVATTGQTVNIEDAYQDPRFNSSFDQQSGYRTKAILAAAVIDQNGDIVAVVQAINKLDGTHFTSHDQILFENLAAHTGVSLRNALIYERAQQDKSKISLLLDVVELLQSDPNIHSLIFTLSQHAPQLVDADRCTLYLVDQSRQQLMVMQGNLDIRLPMTKGIAGYVAATGNVLNIPDAYADPRFSKETDLKSGYRTHTILCMPIFNKAREVIGVLQLINKLDGTPFKQQDEDIIRGLLRITGSIIENAKLFQVKKKTSEVGAATHYQPTQRALSTPRVESMSSFREEEEDDD